MVCSDQGNLGALGTMLLSITVGSGAVSYTHLKGVFYSAGDKPMLTISLKKGEELIARCDELLTTLADLIQAE